MFAIFSASSPVQVGAMKSCAPPAEPRFLGASLYLCLPDLVHVVVGHVVVELPEAVVHLDLVPPDLPPLALADADLPEQVVD